MRNLEHPSLFVLTSVLANSQNSKSADFHTYEQGRGTEIALSQGKKRHVPMVGRALIDSAH